MVKTIDDGDPLLLEHIGVDLWRAAIMWRERLHTEMVQMGHAWYGDARGAVAAHLPPGGLAQSELVLRMSMTKQAVQQLLDGLEQDGVVRREPDPHDGRGKRVVYTAKGRAALRDAVTIKKRIEAELTARLGKRAFEDLRSSLRKIADGGD